MGSNTLQMKRPHPCLEPFVMCNQKTAEGCNAGAKHFLQFCTLYELIVLRKQVHKIKY